MSNATDVQRAEARGIRAVLDNIIPHIASNAAAINASIAGLREWSPGKFATNDVRMRKGIPYKCIAPGHDSTDNPTWMPDTTPTLWMQYHGTSPETARPFVHPTMAEDRYLFDEYFIFTDGWLYRCISMDGSAYSPDESPADYEQVAQMG